MKKIELTWRIVGKIEANKTLDEIGCEERTAKASYDMDYLNLYENYIGKFRNRETILVEIGIWEGASLRTWLRYFEKARIIGFDINPKCVKRVSDLDCEEIIGNQSNFNDLSKIPKCDIIVDDGSHKINDFVKSFKFLFKNRLKKGGIYIIEDLHCVYEREKYGNDLKDFEEFIRYLEEEKIKYKKFEELLIMEKL